jgi:hypothetical protein
LFLSAFLKGGEISDHGAFQFDLETWLLPPVRAILEYLEGGELVLNMRTAEGLLAVTRRLLIPHLVQVLYPFGVFWPSFCDTIAEVTSGKVPSDAAVVAKFLCYCSDADLPDAVVAQVCGHPQFRAPSEDAVLDLVIDRPQVLARVVRFHMLSPAGFGRIFDAFPNMPRKLLKAMAPAFVDPNRQWREDMGSDPRYVDSRVVFEDEIFEYSRRKTGPDPADSGTRKSDLTVRRVGPHRSR